MRLRSHVDDCLRIHRAGHYCTPRIVTTLVTRRTRISFWVEIRCFIGGGSAREARSAA